MNSVSMDKKFLLAFRLLIGWTFLYAGAWQVLSPTFSAADFLAHTKSFHDLYAPLTSPTIAPVLTFLVKWGHFHIVYATATIWLIAANAGHVWGLDGWLAQRRTIGVHAAAMG